jgi:hypothetical protein
MHGQPDRRSCFSGDHVRRHRLRGDDPRGLPGPAQIGLVEGIGGFGEQVVDVAAALLAFGFLARCRASARSG